MNQQPDSNHALGKTAEPMAAVRQRSFPLVALLQLATFWAALAACIDGKALTTQMNRAPDQPVVAAVAGVFAALAGVVLGFAVGLGQLRMWRSAATGAAVGMVYGLVVMAVYVAPAPLERAAAAAAMLVLTTIAFRVGSP